MTAPAPVQIEQLAWVEPTDLLRAVAQPGTVLLESGARGRYSYLAPAPTAVLRRRDAAGVLAEARALLARINPRRPLRAPPFCGGLIGSIGYDVVRGLEVIPVRARDDLGLPCVQLHAVDALYAFDHDRHELVAIARRDDDLRALVAGREAVTPRPQIAGPGSTLTAMPFGAYRDRAEHILAHIARGDVYEVNLTQRLEGPCTSALDLYTRLREGAPVPYNLYLDAGGWQLVGASPERFLRLTADRRIETCPIKGTRPRGATAAEDAALAAALLADPKDRAENVMIVDLARNDLSRVCLPGTVRVSKLLVLESHPTVHQLVSTVEGELAAGFDVFDALAATLAPGSMTGAPKIRAMEIIDELEPVRRGPYAGAFGWIGSDGTCDLAVVIRSAVVTGGRAYLHVGGAIVADSVVEDEYQESLIKARTVRAALGATEA